MRHSMRDPGTRTGVFMSSMRAVRACHRLALCARPRAVYKSSHTLPISTLWSFGSCVIGPVQCSRDLSNASEIVVRRHRYLSNASETSSSKGVWVRSDLTQSAVILTMAPKRLPGAMAPKRRARGGRTDVERFKGLGDPILTPPIPQPEQ